MVDKVNIIKGAVVLVFFAVLFSTTTAAGNVIYVDDSAIGANDGTSWNKAFNHLQDALADANSAEKPVEIRVAQGIYKPDQGTNQTSNDREATFQLINDVVIKGGFAGIVELDADARDVEAYVTILSGDLNGNDTEVANSADLWDESSRVENSYHVITGNLTDETSVLDGFTITAGNANGTYWEGFGGGMYNWEGSPTLNNCTFSGNSAEFGGGMANSENSSPTLTNCTFLANSSMYDAGGMDNLDKSSPTLTNCTFSRNSSTRGSGGLENDRQSSPTLTNCTFSGNSGRYGGGMKNSNISSPILINCTFSGNSAEFGGGGMRNDGESNPTLTNCTFSGNSGECGGGMDNFIESSPTLTNCIFSGNSGQYGGGMHNGGDSSPTLTNCTFIGNSAQDGGVMYNIVNNAPQNLTNCTFSGNSAQDGGGIYNFQSNTILTNCTFAQNSAEKGNALYCDSLSEAPSNVELINCILWDGGNEIWNDENYSTIIITYSNVQGGFPGEGNIDADPFFADAEGPDNILGTEDDGLRLSPISPCVDAGDPNYITEPNETDFAGNPRLRYGCIDMGACEFQGLVYVDDDAPEDPGPGGKLISDPLENGSESHPMDSIQEAIDLAKDGYTVLVLGGIYREPIDFKGKAITVTSGSDVAVLETPGDYAVSFLSAEGPDSILKNFVIRNSLAGVFIPGSSPTIRNLTAVYNEYGITAYTWAEPDISNCIFWRNSEADLFQCVARYSCIEDGGQGQGNISVNPLFVDAENGDYHLMSEGWRWNGSEIGAYDDFTSFCIDAGDPASPLGDELMSAPRDPNNEYGINLCINMGAYGGTCQASMPPLNWIPVYETEPPEPNPAQWAIYGEPREVFMGVGIRNKSVRMTAAEATDASGPAEYFFECTTRSDFSSGWQSARDYEVEVGSYLGDYCFRVKTRDPLGNETEWSEELPVEWR
jgi:hypothetical protein